MKGARSCHPQSQSRIMLLIFCFMCDIFVILGGICRHRVPEPTSRGSMTCSPTHRSTPTPRMAGCTVRCVLRGGGEAGFFWAPQKHLKGSSRPYLPSWDPNTPSYPLSPHSLFSVEVAARKPCRIGPGSPTPPLGWNGGFHVNPSSYLHCPFFHRFLTYLLPYWPGITSPSTEPGRVLYGIPVSPGREPQSSRVEGGGAGRDSDQPPSRSIDPGYETSSPYLHSGITPDEHHGVLHDGRVSVVFTPSPFPSPLYI